MAWSKPPKYRKDGRTKKPEYYIWHAMKQRCRYPKNKSYAIYGGRGIDYCTEWSHFDCFLDDMGPRPSSKHELDRIDNSLGYFKENCRWTIRNVNQANKRRPSKCMGAYKYKTGRWKSVIGIEGYVYHMGSFDTKEEAQLQYKKMFHEWYGFYPNEELL